MFFKTYVTNGIASNPHPGDQLEIIEELNGGSTLGNEDQEHDEHENVTLEDIALTNDAEQVLQVKQKRKVEKRKINLKQELQQG